MYLKKENIRTKEQTFREDSIPLFRLTEHSKTRKTSIETANIQFKKGIQTRRTRSPIKKEEIKTSHIRNSKETRHPSKKKEQSHRKQIK